MSSALLYPPNPTGVPSSVVETSASFKKEVSKVLGSILLFFIVYLLMVMLSIILAIACVYGGLMLIVHVPRVITLLIGIGLMGLGVMVFVFLIKFIFAVNRYDRSGIIEIKKSDEPVLFDFIKQLSHDTQTRFPKKIYLSPDVNACVFYDSSFWSMFFPVRKNLQIGLGLVNCLNISEFKAVVAHEFGHFSQKSMKLGSFVYNVNRIIHNMLFENKDYAKSLSSFARVSSYFAFFAGLTANIVNGIQSILRAMYGVVNKNYMSLSRQMEFHADAVAASVSGGNNLISALKRIDMAHACYNAVLGKCDEMLKEKMVSRNIYPNQLIVLKQVAEDFKFSFSNELPEVNDEYLKSRNLNRVNFKDQWASHPSTEEREDNLNNLGVNISPEPQLAWQLFANKTQVQEQLTRKIYEHIKTDGVTAVDEDFFASKYQTDVQKFSLPAEYKDFYDQRMVAVLDENELDQLAQNNQALQFDTLLSVENISLPAKIKATAADVEILKAIAGKRIDVKSFDFDGEKYPADQAKKMVDDLEKEMEENKKLLEELDRKIIGFFYSRSMSTGNQTASNLKKSYSEYFRERKTADEYLKFLNSMMEDLGSIFRGETIPITTIDSIITNLKNVEEPKFKGYLRRWLELGAFPPNSHYLKSVETFLESNPVYFKNGKFRDSELIALNNMVNESWEAVNTYLFGKFKSILQMQLPLIDRDNNALNELSVRDSAKDPAHLQPQS